MKRSVQINASISTLSGSGFVNFFKAIGGRKIEWRFLRKLIISFFLMLLMSPFRWWERWRWRKKVDAVKFRSSPIFILGHWRSGTTFLHNLICEDPQISYFTTYHAVFPNVLFSGKTIFKPLMKASMPEKRSTDSVKLSVDFPQEEEFAIGNVNPFCYYYWWYFPKEMQSLYSKYVRFENISDKVKEKWKSDYLFLCKQAILNAEMMKGKSSDDQKIIPTVLVSKNPSNTGRIKLLLELFPDARFIHIYRDPVTVFISTKKFFWTTHLPLRFHSITESEMEYNILEIYKKMFDSFYEEVKMIPKENFVEIKFEDLENEPLKYLNLIYHQLKIPDFERAVPRFESYITSHSDYLKTKHLVTDEVREKVFRHWGEMISRWGYEEKK